MEFLQYIKNAPQLLKQSDYSVMILQGAAYPHLFFMQFIENLKFQIDVEIKTIDMQTGDFSFKAQLATSFLGMHCVYWLGDISSLKQKQKDDIITYLKEYSGPHKVIVFMDSKTEVTQNKHLLVASMKDKYFLEDAKGLWVSSDLQQAQKTAVFLHNLYKIKNSFSLDELYLLKNYQDLLTADAKEFYESWVTRLVVPDTSLFTLSQLLFEKKEDAFLKLWHQVQSLYSEIFWVSFWSDQIYRAYFFIALTQEENFAATKQVSFGLSFSFLKQTYKKYQLEELQRFHQAVFTVDCSLKNGGTVYLIDQVYIDFFAGKFRK